MWKILPRKEYVEDMTRQLYVQINSQGMNNPAELMTIWFLKDKKYHDHLPKTIQTEKKNDHLPKYMTLVVPISNCS